MSSELIVWENGDPAILVYRRKQKVAMSIVTVLGLIGKHLGRNAVYEVRSPFGGTFQVSRHSLRPGTILDRINHALSEDEESSPKRLP